MSYYNLSKDYKRLYDLVVTRRVAVGFVDYSEGTLRDVVKITLRGMRRESGIIIGCRGIEYNGTRDDNYADFVKACHECRLEWIL